MTLEHVKRQDVVAVIEDSALWSQTLCGALLDHAGRVVVLRDALDALERIPSLRPAALFIPERPIYATPVQIVRNLCN